MKKNIAVKITNVSKLYKLYGKPIDRLKESIHPLRKKYHKQFYALRNINLEIKKGEVLGIVGVNGAGKSTLLKILAGVLTSTKGRVQIRGELNAILELGASLKSEMTGRENIILNLKINGVEKNREALIEEIIEFADIGEHIDQPVKTYSSGMKSRIGFGIATSTNPDVLIVDEVLAVGDALFQRKCYSKIEKLFKDQKTVIFVSHNAQSVIEFCTRAILLYDRKIILDDTPKKVTDFYQKLVFSKDKEKIVAEINDEKLVNEKIIKKAANKEKIIKKAAVDIEEELYLPYLNSNPVENKSHDVDIIDVRLLNKKGKKVNVCNVHETYKLEYKVRFNEEFKAVRIGNQIRAVQGQRVSGRSVPNKIDSIKFVNKNSIYTVESFFQPRLSNGVYFIGMSVVSNDFNGERVFLTEVHEKLAFKMDSGKHNFWGYCNVWDETKVNGEII